jgi:indole-3-glycerol phosphate synthase
VKIGFRTRRRGTLDKILTQKRAEVARMLAAPPLHPERAPGGRVLEALRREGPSGKLALIAEIKPRSPSAGELSSALTAPERALAYARGGAVMISVLTDQPFFGGGFDKLAAVRDTLDKALNASRPRLLCKEFVIDPIQIDRAVSAGADAVLLIARIVSAEKLAELAAAARARGLEPLVEVATLEELQAAQRAEARVIGVNARDLDTLKMDLERAAAILAAIEPGAIAVHLSGLGAPEDVGRIAKSRADAALIGEALMRQDDPEPVLRAMVNAARS